MMLKWLLTVPRVMEYDDLVEIETNINLMDHSAKRLETAKKLCSEIGKGTYIYWEPWANQHVHSY